MLSRPFFMKAMTNSVKCPVPLSAIIPTRTDEGRVTRNHASRTIGQVAAGMTNSLRTLYFDFQNKDENNCKQLQEKRNDRIKDGAKLSPNNIYGGNVHEGKKIFLKLF